MACRLKISQGLKAIVFFISSAHIAAKRSIQYGIDSGESSLAMGKSSLLWIRLWKAKFCFSVCLFD